MKRRLTERCPDCGQAVKVTRLQGHRERVHGVKRVEGVKGQTLASQLATAWGRPPERSENSADQDVRNSEHVAGVHCPYCHVGWEGPNTVELDRRLQRHLRRVHPARASCVTCGPGFNPRRQNLRHCWPYCSSECRLAPTKRLTKESDHPEEVAPRAPVSFQEPGRAVVPLPKCRFCGRLENEGHLTCCPLANWRKGSGRPTRRADTPGAKELSAEGLGSSPTVGNIPTTYVSFKLLPPGTWDPARLIEHYERETQNWLGRREVQPGRLRDLETLNPTRRYIGTDLWCGYILYLFPWSTAVVLDCPIDGNATYVVSGDWKRMARHTKWQLRTRFPERITKVVHKGGWLVRVWEALYSNRLQRAISETQLSNSGSPPRCG